MHHNADETCGAQWKRKSRKLRTANDTTHIDPVFSSYVKVLCSQETAHVRDWKRVPTVIFRAFYDRGWGKLKKWFSASSLLNKTYHWANVSV